MNKVKGGWILFLLISVFNQVTCNGSNIKIISQFHGDSDAYKNNPIVSSEHSFSSIMEDPTSSKNDQREPIETKEERPWPLLRRRMSLEERNSKPSLFTFSVRRKVNSESTNDGDDEVLHELSVHVVYEDIYDTLVFLLAIYAAGKIASLLGMPSLVGEIIVGFLLGPPLADYVPYAEAMVLIGEIGLILLLVEAGIDVDVNQLKVTGGRALAIACTGATVALLVGFGISMGSGLSVKGAIAAGAAFSPTSLGVASKALATGEMLNTPTGQLIIAACVLDDVIALIILSIIEVLVEPDPKPFDYVKPVLSSFGYLIVLGYSAITWMPKFIEHKFLPLFSPSKRELVAFILMFALTMGYLPMFYYSKASYLTGAFISGLTFSQINSIHATFVHNTHRLLQWLLRIFFAATIGFQIPIKSFFDGKVIGWGLAFYIPVLAKLPLGMYSPRFQTLSGNTSSDLQKTALSRDRLTIGWAMTCRGEFSFIIASFALRSKLISAQAYSQLVFAVLLSCISCPFVLLFTIKYFNKKSMNFVNQVNEEGDELLSKSGEAPLFFAIQIRSDLVWGLQNKVAKCVNEAGLVIIDHRSWQPRGLKALVVTELYVHDTTMKYNTHSNEQQASKMLLVDSTDDDVDEDEDIETSAVQKRALEIEESLLRSIVSQDIVIRVSQWFPHSQNLSDNLSPEEEEAIHLEASQRLDKSEVLDKNLSPGPYLRVSRIQSDAGKRSDFFTNKNEPLQPLGTLDENIPPPEATRIQIPRRPRPKRNKMLSVPDLNGDLWAYDKEAQTAVEENEMIPNLDAVMVTSLRTHRKKVASQKANLFQRENLATVDERLEGFVRHRLDDPNAKNV